MTDESAVIRDADTDTYRDASGALTDFPTSGGGAVSSVFTRTGAVTAAAGDYTAAQVTNVAAGGIAAVTVQAALNELDTEKQPLDADLTALSDLNAATGKTTPVDADLVPVADSAASFAIKKLTWANLKATAKAYFDTLYDATGAAAAAQAASQPLDSDLTALAGLSPTNDDLVQRKAGAWTNRSIAQLLTDLAAAGTTFQPLDSDLTSIAALATTSFGRSVLTQADAAALRTLAGLGSLATLSTITSSEITDGTIVSADLAAALLTSLQPWTVVTKSGDTSRNTTTTVSVDPHLVFTPAAGTLYEFQMIVLFTSTSTTPDFKFAFGQDGTVRGSMAAIGIGTNDGASTTSVTCRTSGVVSLAAGDPGSGVAARLAVCSGWYQGSGASAGLYWSQVVSDSTNVTVLTGSVLRYRSVPA